MALTPAQVRQHIGAMLVGQLDAIVTAGETEALGAALLVRWAIDYIRNGPGPIADRREAMSFFLRRLYRASTQQDADLTPHMFRAHWIGNDAGEIT